MRGRQVEMLSSTRLMPKTRSAQLGVGQLRRSDAVARAWSGYLRARYSGRIKSFNASKGYGFISCDETSGPQWLLAQAGLEGKDWSTLQLRAEAVEVKLAKQKQ